VGTYTLNVETLAKVKYRRPAKTPEDAAKLSPVELSASFYSTPVRLAVTPAPPATAPASQPAKAPAK
jgi:hypothetical protein